MGIDTEVTTRTTRGWLGDDGIMQFVVWPGMEQNVEDAKENVAAAVLLAAGHRRPTMVDMTYVKSVTRDARQAYASEELARGCSAIALVVGSPLARVVGNFIVSVIRRDVPTRLFSSPADANAWLRQFVDTACAGAAAPAVAATRNGRP